MNPTPENFMAQMLKAMVEDSANTTSDTPDPDADVTEDKDSTPAHSMVHFVNHVRNEFAKDSTTLRAFVGIAMNEKESLTSINGSLDAICRCLVAVFLEGIQVHGKYFAVSFIQEMERQIENGRSKTN